MESYVSGITGIDKRPYTIVLGNTKGGTGKSTLAMHLSVALMRMGYRVGTMDLDGVQGTLSRYLAHRFAHAESRGDRLPMPIHIRVQPAELDQVQSSEAEERRRLRAAFQDVAGVDFVVMDTPGSDTLLTRLGHACADTLITPLNDSLVDIDVLAQIDAQKRHVLGPSIYTRMVWELTNSRIAANDAPIDWIVVRNRLGHIGARNMLDVTHLMEKLAARIGFRLAPGLGERVIFRELFLSGLTIFDLDLQADDRGNASRLAARQEIIDLLSTIGVATEARAA